MTRAATALPDVPLGTRCRCRHEFCYLCGQKWKRCMCPVFDERRLLQRAEHIADRPQDPAGLVAPREERVQQIVRNLRERHECGHDGRWERIQGLAVCEHCEDTLEEYILECPQCLLRACNRCKLNRV